jgi:hypothetical protein
MRRAQENMNQFGAIAGRATALHKTLLRHEIPHVSVLLKQEGANLRKVAGFSLYVIVASHSS